MEEEFGCSSAHLRQGGELAVEFGYSFKVQGSHVVCDYLFRRHVGSCCSLLDVVLHSKDRNLRFLRGVRMSRERGRQGSSSKSNPSVASLLLHTSVVYVLLVRSVLRISVTIDDSILRSAFSRNKGYSWRSRRIHGSKR